LRWHVITRQRRDAHHIAGKLGRHYDLKHLANDRQGIWSSVFETGNDSISCANAGYQAAFISTCKPFIAM